MENLQWIIALAVSIVSMVGGIIVRDRQVIRMINSGDERICDKLSQVEKNYVRIEHMNGHIKTIENMIQAMRQEQQETNRRIDMVLSEIARRDC